jgi:hypothetical protein
MASGGASSRTRIVLVIFVLVWLVAVGLMYAQFQASPVREMSVRDGVILGEKGFVEARANACAGMTLIWTFLLVVILGKVRSGNRAASNPQVAGTPTSETAAEGWRPDPTTRHELRYWNGSAWTENVSDAGVTGVDPPDAQG